MNENKINYSDLEMVDASEIPYSPKRQIWDILLTDAESKLPKGKALVIKDLKQGARIQSILWLKHKRGLYLGLTAKKRGQKYYLIKENAKGV